MDNKECYPPLKVGDFIKYYSKWTHNDMYGVITNISSNEVAVDIGMSISYAYHDKILENYGQEIHRGDWLVVYEFDRNRSCYGIHQILVDHMNSDKVYERNGMSHPRSTIILNVGKNGISDIVYMQRLKNCFFRYLYV